MSMRFTCTVLAFLSAFAVSQAWADDPTSAAAAPTPAATPAAPPAASPTSAAAAAITVAPTATPESVKASELEEQNKRMRSLGYKPEVQRDGTTLYCRREPTLGTHFDKKICSTPQEMERVAAEAREETEHVQHQGRALSTYGH
jgi:hypothetical protein